MIILLSLWPFTKTSLVAVPAGGLGSAENPCLERFRKVIASGGILPNEAGGSSDTTSSPELPMVTGGASSGWSAGHFKVFSPVHPCPDAACLLFGLSLSCVFVPACQRVLIPVFFPLPFPARPPPSSFGGRFPACAESAVRSRLPPSAGSIPQRPPRPQAAKNPKDQP